MCERVRACVRGMQRGERERACARALEDEGGTESGGKAIELSLPTVSLTPHQNLHRVPVRLS
jgi:hypothetical protein